MKKIAVYLSLILVSVFALAACASEAYPEPQTESTTEYQTDTPAPARIEFAPPENPLIPYEFKPPLEFFNGAEKLGAQVIGFTFPGDGFAIKAATFEDFYSSPYGSDPEGKFTPVGLVEIGEGTSSEIPPGPYRVMLDLQSSEQFVDGQLRSLYAEDIFAQFKFLRTPQSINGERFSLEKIAVADSEDVGWPPTSSVTIIADGVCFILKPSPPPEGMEYLRYCSEVDSVLSTRANFKDQYAGLVESMQATADRLGLSGIQVDLTISEMEDLNHILRCSEKYLAGDLEGIQQECGSDINAAPVDETTYKGNYAAGYDKMLSSQSSQQIRSLLATGLPAFFRQDDPYADKFPVAVAAVQVLHPIDSAPEFETTDGSDMIEPGEYRLEYWFDANQVFFAATISGFRSTDGGEVINQQVPAVPATFVNADGTEQTSAQISTCRIFGRCVFFQRTCP